MRFKDFCNMNESLYANERKLKKLLTLALGKDVEEFITPDKYAPEELILIRTSILKEISEEEFKKICEDAGYYCSIHYNDRGEPLKYDPIYVTPINQKVPLNIGEQEYYHCSDKNFLDKTGLKIKARPVDNDFDIYKEGRIYLCPTALAGDPKELVNMVASEHHCDPKDITVYLVKLPKGYPIYQDPTKLEAVYVTNSIPAKYVKKYNQNG